MVDICSSPLSSRHCMPALERPMLLMSAEMVTMI